VARTADDVRGDLIRRIMCAFRVDRRAVEEAHGLRFDEDFSAELVALRALEANGLVALSRSRSSSRAGPPVRAQRRRRVRRAPGPRRRGADAAPLVERLS
jgi:coproporphyrinogen III oxidase-like Fe-S oxidoreductase